MPFPRLLAVVALAPALCTLACGGSPETSNQASQQLFSHPKAPASWDRSVSRPTDDDATAARASCAYRSGALAAETLGPSTPVGEDIPIQNVVVLMLENRSFDSYFARLADYTGRTDIEVATVNDSNPEVAGDSTTPLHYVQHAPTLCEADTGHEWGAAHLEYDYGLVDGFFQANDGKSDGKYDASLLSGDRALWYYDQTDIPFYYALASTFGIGDHYHSSLLGPTYPNRDFLYAATSRGTTTDATLGTGGLGFPDHDLVIFDELEKRSVSWKVYHQGIVAGIESTLGASTILRWGWLAYPEHFKGADDFFEDARNGNLPQVAFVDPQLTGTKPSLPTEPYETKSDEHPPGDIQVGEKFTSDVVHALMSSPEWGQLALFITWDENGGLYDHVAPPSACPPDDLSPNLTNADDQAYPGGFDQLGFRVPVIVVSPYSKPSYVSHVTYDHTSITRFIEAKFKVPALSARDANADPMMDFFDFSGASFASPPDVPEATVDQARLDECKTLYGQ